MSDYDPNKVEDWIVGANGFWRKGDVNASRWNVAFRGTWSQVRDRHDAMIALNRQHYAERLALEDKQRAEQKQYWPEA